MSCNVCAAEIIVHRASVAFSFQRSGNAHSSHTDFQSFTLSTGAISCDQNKNKKQQRNRMLGSLRKKCGGFLHYIHNSLKMAEVERRGKEGQVLCSCFHSFLSHAHLSSIAAKFHLGGGKVWQQIQCPSVPKLQGRGGVLLLTDPACMPSQGLLGAQVCSLISRIPKYWPQSTVLLPVPLL